MNEEMTICEALDQTYLKSPQAWRILRDRIYKFENDVAQLEFLMNAYKEAFEKAIKMVNKDERIELLLEHAQHVQDGIFQMRE